MTTSKAAIVNGAVNFALNQLGRIVNKKPNPMQQSNLIVPEVPNKSKRIKPVTKLPNTLPNILATKIEPTLLAIAWLSF